jgi:hypothetical protein
MKMTKHSFRICVILQAFLSILLLCTMPVSAQDAVYSDLTPVKNANSFILMAIFGLAALAGIVLFILFGKDKKVYPTAEKSPPADITSVEASFILDGQIKAEDIPSLLIFWANKGYLSINNICEAGTDELEFEKLKNADANMKPYEKLIFDKLFNGRSIVPLADFKGAFNIDLRKIKIEPADSISAPSTRFFTKASTVTAIICGLMAGLCTGVMPIFTAVTQNLSTLAGILLAILAFIVTICFCILLKSSVNKTVFGQKFSTYTIIFIVALLIMAGFSGFTAAALISSASAGVCGIVAALSKKHTSRGSELLGKLLGLKQFITTVDKDKIDQLTAENPTLFYDLLPFAFALGVADKWAMQFENTAVAKPSWFNSSTHGLFNPLYFTNLINNIIGNKRFGENAFAISAFAGHKGFESGSRTRIP